MKTAIPAQLVPWVAQVRANPRLQAGLAFILLLVLAWAFLTIGDWRDATIIRLEQARNHQAQVRRLAGQDVWTQRAADASRLADALEAEIPPAKSPGLAQASLQGWLGEIVDNTDANLRVDTQAPTRVEGPNTIAVTATIEGGISPARAWDLIHRIESSPALVTIPAVLVRSDGANQTMSLTVRAYYRLPDVAGDPEP